MTSQLNIEEIKTEIVVFLRNQDILTTTQRGVTTTTEEFDGDGNETDFTVSQANIKNVRSVTVDGSPVEFGSGYSVDYDTATITFASAPGVGTDNVDIQYDYGTDAIFPDFPRPDLKISSFPRIGLDMIGMNTTELGIGGTSNQTDMSFSVIIFGPVLADVDTYVFRVRNAIQQNKKEFYNLKFITNAIVGPTLPFGEGKQKIFQKNVDIVSVYNIEEV